MAQVGVRNIEIFGREIRNNDIRRQRPERDEVRPVPEPVLGRIAATLHRVDVFIAFEVNVDVDVDAIIG